MPSNVQSSRQEALLYVFEDNEAVIKMIIKGRSPTMRHVSRTHWVALWLGTRDEWNHLLCLFNIRYFNSADCSEVMSTRTQKDSGEEWVTTKSKPMMSLVSRCSERTPYVLLSIASESQGKTRHESQCSSEPMEWAAWKNRETTGGMLIKLTWSSQGWKSDELMEVRNRAACCNRTSHTDRITVESDKMNSYTEADSEMS